MVEFEIRPEHGWLARVIGLLPDWEKPEDEDAGPVVRGEIDDHGTLTTEDGHEVTAGWMGGYLVVHESCWEIAGRPHAEQLRRSEPSDLEPFQQQYFEWGECEKAGEAWKLDPPLGSAPGSTRNKERIEARTASVRAAMKGKEPASLGGAKPAAAPRRAAPSRPEPLDDEEDEADEAPAPAAAASAAPIHKRLEKLDGGTKKFWEIRTEGARFEIRYGDVGGAERMPFTRDCASAADAVKQAADLVKGRLADGFVEVAVGGG